METLIILVLKMDFNIFKKFLVIIFCFSAIFLNCGCVTRDISQKGYMFDEDDLSNIKVGLTNKENTLKYLGYPLNRSYFDDNVWIYYSYKMKEVLFFKPSLKDQKVLVVEFDDDTDLIKNLSLYDVNSDNYEILDATTEVEEEKENVIRDILKNIGQISM